MLTRQKNGYLVTHTRDLTKSLISPVNAANAIAKAKPHHVMS